MNRAFFNLPINEGPAKINPLHRPAKQFRLETESLLRDMAYVLQLTCRVKEQILEEEEQTVGV